MSPAAHDEIAELLGAYALDAVDPDERALVDAHLPNCPRCAAEVAEHREVAAMLANSGADAPDGLWARILGSLEEAPPEIDLPAVIAAAPTPAPHTVRAPREPVPAPVVPIGAAPNPTRRTNRWMPAAAAVVAVCALAVGVLIGQAARSESPDIVAQPTLGDVARQVLNDANSRRVELSGDDERYAATAAIGPDGSGYLIGSGLPDAGAGRTYQLWGVRGGATVSLGLLGAAPDVVSFHVDDTIEAIAITEEDAGGVATSVNPVLLLGDVS